ncbi:adhesion G protein-coupled receptor E3 [Biomphalaria glabrata]|nr:adhesion G protein-coupled receptor E3 [Biomphalaria glabrata]
MTISYSGATIVVVYSLSFKICNLYFILLGFFFQIRKDVLNINDGYSYQLGVTQKVNISLTDTEIPVLWINIEMLASHLLTRDAFENMALDIFFGNRLKNEEKMFNYYKILVDRYDISCAWSNKFLSLRYKSFLTSKYYYTQCANNVILSPTLACQYLIFKRTNFTLVWTTTNGVKYVIVMLDVGGIKLKISSLSDMNSMELTESKELYICVKVLEEYFNTSKSTDKGIPMYETLNVLTYICISASELCLVLTLVTYLVFPELRTVPGINNMFLSLSLLLAQMALVTASNM